MSRKTPKVGAIVLNWNGLDKTVRCVESIQRLDDDISITVVDNGSSDGSGAKVESKFPDVTVLFNNENLGFAGGMNAGIRHFQEKEADYIWLLNNDVVMPEKLDVGSLLGHFRDDVGMVTPKVVSYDTDETWFVKGTVGSISKNAKHQSEPAVEANTRGETAEISNDYVPFCSVLIDTTVIDEVGLLPEEYFLYYEDVDYCFDVRKAGYKILTVPSAVVFHESSSSSGGQYGHIYSYYRFRNQLLFAEGKTDAGFLWYYLLSLVMPILLRVIKLQLTSIGYIFLGIWDGVRSRSGKGPIP